MTRSHLSSCYKDLRPEIPDSLMKSFWKITIFQRVSYSPCNPLSEDMIEGPEIGQLLAYQKSLSSLLRIYNQARDMRLSGCGQEHMQCWAGQNTNDHIRSIR